VDNNEIQKYEKMIETLHSEGWDLIRNRLVEMFNNQNNVLAIGDEKAFWQMRGSLGMLHLMIEFENVLKAELEGADEVQSDVE
jgi:hypothetical protein